MADGNTPPTVAEARAQERLCGLEDRLVSLGQSMRSEASRAGLALARVHETNARIDALRVATCAGERASIRPAPPHDMDGECVVLSALLWPGVSGARKAVTPRERRSARRVAECQAFDPWPIVARWLDPVDFYSEAHGRIFGAILETVCDGAPRGRRAALRSVTLPDVMLHLRDIGRVAQIGGVGYLMELAHQWPATSARGLAATCQRLAELAARRRVIATLQRVTAEGYTGDASFEDMTRGLAAILERELLDVRKRGGTVFEDALGRPR